jgi:hypothetical protein
MVAHPSRRLGAERGQVRDALLAVRNLEALLRSPRVGARALTPLLPEAGEACASLGAVLAGRGTADVPGWTDLIGFALERLDALQRALRDAAGGELGARARLALETIVIRARADLDAAFELVELVDCAAAALPTELSLKELVRASLGIEAGIARGDAGDEIEVRVDTREAVGVLVADAHVVARLLTAGIARVHASTAGAITVSARGAPHEARVCIAPSRAADARLPVSRARLARRVPATDAVVEHAARAVGARFVAWAACAQGLDLTLPRA